MRRVSKGQRGQAMVEYASMTGILSLGLLAVAGATPVIPRFFEAIQAYVDLMFYALNLAGM